jgi:hypothetical protein
MTRCGFSYLRIFFVVGLLEAASVGAVGQPMPAAVAGFDSYVDRVEGRLARQHGSRDGFIAGASLSAGNDARLRRGELIVEQLSPGDGVGLPGALLHHWRGTAFAPGATAADFERLMRDFDAYPRRFAPQVLRAAVVAQEEDRWQADRMQAFMRVRQRHVITVVMDTSYDIRFGRLDLQHGYSNSRSTRMAEIDGAGTSKERVLGADEEHGFLWRQNTYWSYEERDGGLYMQVESVSLTRSIPTGLGWAVRPFVGSIPRESLEFTLRAVCDALKR